MKRHISLMFLIVIANLSYSTTIPMVTYAEMWAQSYDSTNPQYEGNILSMMAQTNYGKKVSQISEVDLAFAGWSSDLTLITDPDKNINSWFVNDGQTLVPSSTNAYQIDPEYMRWSLAAWQANDMQRNTKFLVSFGGWTFGSIWKYLSTASDEQIESLAIEINSQITYNHPVYNTWSWWTSKKDPIGTVQLDGLDLDLEATDNDQAIPFTDQEKDAIKKLVTDLKSINPNLTITLTTRLNSADTPDSPSITPNTSTAGELLSLLQDPDFMKNIASVNVMAYDSGSKEYQDSGYTVSMGNYKKAISTAGTNTPVSLGTSMLEQFGDITESNDDLVNKAQWIRENNSDGGMMIWAVESNGTGDEGNFHLENDALITIGNALSPSNNSSSLKQINNITWIDGYYHSLN